MSLNATQASALSRLFSSNVFHEMARKGRSPLFARLFSETGVLRTQVATPGTVGCAFETAFSLLRKTGKRDEYVYKAALIHNILLGRHSLNSASMLTEFRAGSCKADLVILNGTSTVYEIKSDRDSLSRLQNQVENYRKVFAKIYIIAGESHISEVLKSTPSDVGVMELVRWNRIRTVRESREDARLVCPCTIFDSLRVEEASAILKGLGISVPQVPNTKIRGAMRAIFQSLKPVDVHHQMVRILKRTRNLASLSSLIEEVPASLRPAALAIHIRKADRARLLAALSTPIDVAAHW